MLVQKEGIKVTSLEKCDFRPMYEHFEREREKKKAMSKEEKKASVTSLLSPKC